MNLKKIALLQLAFLTSIVATSGPEAKEGGAEKTGNGGDARVCFYSEETLTRVEAILAHNDVNTKNLLDPLAGLDLSKEIKSVELLEFWEFEKRGAGKGVRQAIINDTKFSDAEALAFDRIELIKSKNGIYRHLLDIAQNKIPVSSWVISTTSVLEIDDSYPRPAGKNCRVMQLARQIDVKGVTIVEYEKRLTDLMINKTHEAGLYHHEWLQYLKRKVRKSKTPNSIDLRLVNAYHFDKKFAEKSLKDYDSFLQRLDFSDVGNNHKKINFYQNDILVSHYKKTQRGSDTLERFVIIEPISIVVNKQRYKVLGPTTTKNRKITSTVLANEHILGSNILEANKVTWENELLQSAHLAEGSTGPYGIPLMGASRFHSASNVIESQLSQNFLLQGEVMVDGQKKPITYELSKAQKKRTQLFPHKEYERFKKDNSINGIRYTTFEEDWKKRLQEINWPYKLISFSKNKGQLLRAYLTRENSDHHGNPIIEAATFYSGLQIKCTYIYNGLYNDHIKMIPSKETCYAPNGNITSTFAKKVQKVQGFYIEGEVSFYPEGQLQKFYPDTDRVGKERGRGDNYQWTSSLKKDGFEILIRKANHGHRIAPPITLNKSGGLKRIFLFKPHRVDVGFFSSGLQCADYWAELDEEGRIRRCLISEEFTFENRFYAANNYWGFFDQEGDLIKVTKKDDKRVFDTY